MSAAPADSIRVLHVEPDPDFASRVSERLESSGDLTVVGATTAARARKILATEDIDCVVSAATLPDTDGLTFLEECRDAHPDCPFVLFAEEDGGGLAMETIATDQAEFLSKRRNSEQLERLATRVKSIATYARMQRYLREREIPFRALVEYSSDLVTVLEPDGTVAYASPSAEYILGYTPTQIVGESAFGDIHPEDRERVEEAFAGMLTSPDPNPAIEYRLRHADGDWRVVESRTSNKLEHSAIEGLVVNTRDITRRKRAEDRLRENKAKIERLHETAASLADCESEREIYERTVEAAESILDFDICVVDVERDGLLEVAASRGLPAEKSPTLSVEEGLAGETYRTGQSSLVTDTRESAVAMPQGNYLSVLSVPVGDHGVFQAAAEEVDAFDQDDLELAELLVTHTASALDRVERETRLRRQAEQLADIADHTTDDLTEQLDTARRRLERAGATGDDEALAAAAAAHERLAETVDELLELADAGPQPEAETPAE